MSLSSQPPTRPHSARAGAQPRRARAPRPTPNGDAWLRLKERLALRITATDRWALSLVEQARPPSLRGYDQIPMRGHDLLRHVHLIGPSLADARVVFMGDSDGTSILLGLLSTRGGPRPAALHLVDFDERLLDVALDLAAHHGFSDLLHAWRYNAFDSVPPGLVGRCDWFHTNPPYGASNEGGSARLFIARGAEMINPDRGAGCIVLPDDPHRPWTGAAMRTTLQFLDHHGWTMREKLHALHQYHLDDDRELSSDLIIVSRAACKEAPALPYAGRRVAFDEIPHFYGRGTPPPYARYIAGDGKPDQDWTTIEEQAHEWQHPAGGKVA